MKESTTRGRREISVTNVQSQFLDDRCFGIETTNSRRGDPREKNLALFPSSRMAFGGNPRLYRNTRPAKYQSTNVVDP